MGILNSLIMSINMSLGDKVNLYRGFYVLGFLTIFVFNVFYAKKFDIKKGRALVVTVLSYALIFAWAFVLAWVESLFTDWGHHNAVRVYIWMPALLFVMSKPVAIDWKKLCISYSINTLFFLLFTLIIDISFIPLNKYTKNIILKTLPITEPSL